MLRIRSALMREQHMLVNQMLILTAGHQRSPSAQTAQEEPGQPRHRRGPVSPNFIADAPNVPWLIDIERHEALLNREEVRDLLHRTVAADR